MNITVYLGSSPGNDPKLNTVVRALGRWIGESGHALVYGGSRTGLMGALAEAPCRPAGKSPAWRSPSSWSKTSSTRG